MDWKKYSIAFLITAAIFATAIYLNNRFDRARLSQIETIQERVATDILSLETQFDLLRELSCEDIRENSILTSELNALAERLGYAEDTLGSDNEEVVRLKRQYSLLEIKDYLLMKRVTEKCKTRPVFILYFYSNKGDCPDCAREGAVLTYFRERYPQLRVYSFDYNLDLGALQTLIALNNIEETLPALVIGNQAHYGFKDRGDIEAILPILKEFDKQNVSVASSTSTKN